MQISKVTPTFNNSSKMIKNNVNYSNNNITFSSAHVNAESKFFNQIEGMFSGIKNVYVKKIKNPMETGIENFFLKIIQTKPFEKLVNKIYKTQEAKKVKIAKFNEGKQPENQKKFSSNLFSHLIVIGSTILSGFYVVKTINNKKLEEKKRRTLAINQAAVWLASTIMAYTVDGKLNKWVNKVKADFNKLDDLAKVKNPLQKKHIEGIGKARSIMVIDTIYRFIAPVAMTPIANYIGNKINENK